MENNNLSRKMFALFAKENQLKSIGKRNVVEVDGKRSAFTISDKKHIECRQFYEDCSTLIVLNPTTGIIGSVSRQNLRFNGVSRVTADGLRAFNTNASSDDLQPTSYKYSI